MRCGWSSRHSGDPIPISEFVPASQHFDLMKIITDERCADYWQPGHPERPARIQRTLEKLRRQTELPLTWAEPPAPKEHAILRAHSP